MIKRNQIVLNFINILSDAALIMLAYFASMYIRYYVLHGTKMFESTDEFFVNIVGFYSLVIVFIYYVSHLYRSQRMRRIGTAAAKIWAINGLGTLALMALFYYKRILDFSRGALVIFWVVSSGFVLLKHVLLRLVLHYYRKNGYNLKHVAIVGNGANAMQYVKDVKKHPEYGFRIAGYFSKSEGHMKGNIERLGEYETIGTYLQEHQLDELIVALEPHENQFMKYVLEAADKEGIRVNLIPFFNDYYPARPTFEVVGNTKLINMRANPLDNIGWAILKRLTDIVGSLIAIIIFAIPMLIIAVGVKLSSPGPVFFVQERVGRGKKPFKMLKFRSMRTDIDHNGWSTDKDDRKTKFGSFIRKFSLDELPQFFNVFAGHMSLVGPRPELPHYVRQFKEEVPLYLVRQQVRPGITGWAQVNGLRGDTSIESRVEYDIWYIENWSIGLDIKILFKTVFGGMVNSEEIVIK